MRVTLINATHDALNLLLFTKQTRLTMSPDLMNEIAEWPEDKKLAEIEYMARTIRSSWEFLDVTFLVGGISRACAQQMTRTRNASFAMQSQRVTDVSSMEIYCPDRIAQDKVKKGAYDACVGASLGSYKRMLADGFSAEDARGVLPMNITCNLVAKYNLRAFVDLMKTRTSLRAQGEYADVARAMKACVMGVWPWAKPFFADEHAVAIAMIEDVAKELSLTPGKGPGWELAKAVDLLRKA